MRNELRFRRPKVARNREKAPVGLSIVERRISPSPPKEKQSNAVRLLFL